MAQPEEQGTHGLKIMTLPKMAYSMKEAAQILGLSYIAYSDGFRTAKTI